ncbi:MAG: hypothetical protein GY714_20275 [Desulfobacterales bacterium]|nr:hypothetical protein [Desulfobacterales bacterium]
MEIPFVGGAYTGYSKNINAQECINLFPAVDQRDAKNIVALYGTPGITSFSEIIDYLDNYWNTVMTSYWDTAMTALWNTGMDTILGDPILVVGPNRGAHAFGSVMYTGVNASINQVETNGSNSSLGTISTSVGDIYFADNGTEVIVVDGTDQGYLVTAGVLAVIADGDFPVATSVTFQDGYFIITSDLGRIYISGLYDGTSWDPLEFTTAEANPDAALLVLSNANDLWVFGEETTEVFYNSGNVDFPFTRISGAILELGIQARASAVKINGIIYWLSNEKRIIRSRGYQFDTVSTVHIDYQISTYDTTTDAKGFTYTLMGHIFYVLTFPTEMKTWVYDVTTDFWHEWQSFTDVADVYSRHRMNSCVKFDGKYIIGDYTYGQLFELDIDVYADDDNTIRRIRTSPTVNKERKNIIWHRLEVDFETGVGLDVAEEADGYNPTATFAWSDDGGHTFSSEYSTSLGLYNEFTTRVVRRRLGKSRNRIYRITMTDPVKIVMLAAYAEVEECTV